MDDLPAGVKEDVLKILSDYLEVPATGFQPNQSLEELGADSLDFVEIVFEIEEKLGIKADEDLTQLRKRMHTIGDVLHLVSGLVAKAKAAATPPVAAASPGPNAAPLA